MTTPEQEPISDSSLQDQLIDLQRQLANTLEKVQSVLRYQSFLASSQDLDNLSDIVDKTDDNITSCFGSLQESIETIRNSTEENNAKIDACLDELRIELGPIIAKSLLEDKSLDSERVDTDTLDKKLTQRNSERLILRHVLEFFRQVAMLAINVFPSDLSEFSSENIKEFTSKDIRSIIKNSPLNVQDFALSRWMSGRTFVVQSHFEKRILEPLVQTGKLSNEDAQSLTSQYLEICRLRRLYLNGVATNLEDALHKTGNVMARSIGEYRNTIQECIISLYNFTEEDDETKLQTAVIPLREISILVHNKLKNLLKTKKNGRQVVSARTIERWLTGDRCPSYGGLKDEYILRLEQLGQLSNKEVKIVLNLLGEARKHYELIRQSEKQYEIND